MKKSKLPLGNDPNGMPPWADEEEMEPTADLLPDDIGLKVLALMKKQDEANRQETEETDATEEGLAKAIMLGDLRRSKALRASFRRAVRIGPSSQSRKPTPKKLASTSSVRQSSFKPICYASSVQKVLK